MVNNNRRTTKAQRDAQREAQRQIRNRRLKWIFYIVLFIVILVHPLEIWDWLLNLLWGFGYDFIDWVGGGLNGLKNSAFGGLDGLITGLLNGVIDLVNNIPFVDIEHVTSDYSGTTYEKIERSEINIFDGGSFLGLLLKLFGYELPYVV